MKNILQANNRTLLGSFVNGKVRKYAEPSREGTPRGEPIGFSGTKYGAALYGLTNLKQKEIAQHLEISHGLLRKWNTEEPFKAMVDKHCREFAEVFLANTRNRVKRRKILLDKYEAKNMETIAAQAPPSMGYDEISDAAYYSEKVNDYITNGLLTEANKAIAEHNFTLSLEIYSMIDALKFFWGEKQSDDAKGKDKGIARRLAKSLIQEGIATLLKPALDEQDKKSLLIIFKTLERDAE